MTTMNELREFAKDFVQNIYREAGSNSDFAENAFFDEFCEHLMEAGELETADRALYISHSSLGIRVDGYGGDPLESSGTLCLIISDFKPSDDIEVLNRSEMESLLKRPLRFLKQSLILDWRISLEESSQGYGLASLIESRWNDIKRIRILLISNRELRLRVDGMKADKIDGRQVTYNVWDITRLHKFVKSGQSREEMVIDLEDDFNEPVALLPAHATADGQHSYLAVLPGKTLAEIYDKWETRLLEQNVRVFLQARGKVNKGIRNTLVQEPDMFFAYNNGITCTAESVVLKKNGDQALLKQINNFQIVNGGQTTASIHTAYLDGVDISDVFVQMKLSVVQANETEVIVPKISEYANTQNRVQAADFFSNHPFHIRIENFSRRLFAPSSEGAFKESKWFYERARGQYADARARLSRAKRNKFDQENPRSQVMTKTDLAKYLNVWSNNPERVHLGAQKNFSCFSQEIGSQWDENSDNINEEFFREAVAKAIVFKTTQKIVSSQSWYEGGYRANIVAYSISKLANLVQERSRSIDFSLIWKHQEIGEGMSNILAIIAKQVLGVLLDTPSTISNVTEWAKKRACWEEIRKLQFGWPSELNDETITLGEKKSIDKEARRDQKFLSGVEAQMAVIGAGASFWKELFEWGGDKRLLSRKDQGVLKVAVQMENSVSLPSERQSILILEIYERMREEGYMKELAAP